MAFMAGMFTGAVAIGVLVFVWSLCWAAGKSSRQEERDNEDNR